MKNIPMLVLVCLFFMRAAAAAASDSITVNVTVEGFENNKGYCRLLVYETKKGFPDEPAYATVGISVRIEDKNAEFSFSLKPGIYAISILHDENSNEKMDKTWYGKPREGFGLSNNPKIKFRSPSFDDAAVKIDADNSKFIIRLSYL